MSEMIDRVAKALFSCSVYHGYDDATLEREWQRTAGLHRRAAKVAIEAMREPTEAMVKAGGAADVSDHMEVYEDIYRAMIDAALSPSSGNESMGEVEHG